MVTRRILDQEEATSLSGEDFLIADNANLGTRKISFERLLSGVTPLPPNYLTGLEITKNSNTSFSVSVGYARSMDNVRNIILNNSLVKDLSQTFGLGNAGCMPDSLTLQQNTKYYVFALVNAGGLVDIIVDTNINCNNGLNDSVAIDNNFNKYALIGEIQTSSGSATIFRVESYSSKMTIQDILDISVKAGTILPWAGDVIPYGYLACNGAEVSRTTYADLFSVCGTIWGVGDGATTFNVPNLVNRFLQGGNVGTYNTESLPNITGRLGSTQAEYNRWEGAFWNPGGSGKGISSGGSGSNQAAFDASRSSSTYQDNARVQPDNAEVMYIIKY